MTQNAEEIAANIQRAKTSVQAAKDMLEKEYFDRELPSFALRSILRGSASASSRRRKAMSQRTFRRRIETNRS